MRGQSGILYDGFEVGPNFERARTQISTPFAYLDVALDVAGVDQYYDICGDFLYFDALYDGVVSIELNNQQTASKAPFKASQGFALSAIFTRIKLNWAAQTGKKVRIMYSTGDRVVPSNSAVTSISGTVDVNEKGASWGTSYKSTTALSINTPDNIFAAASNTAGGTLWSAANLANLAGTVLSPQSYLMKATAPASAIDGDVLVQNSGWAINGAGSYCWMQMPRALRFASGKRLDYISAVAEFAAMRSALYTLN